MNKEKMIVFGAGEYGRRVIDLVGREMIAFFLDNDVDKQKVTFFGFAVKSLAEVMNIIHQYIVIIAVSEKYTDELVKQLQKAEIFDYKTFQQLQMEITKKKIEARIDYIAVYKRAIHWIENYSIQNEGIINNTGLQKSYPEVTGYYIPTLIQWGYRDLAISYAKWLCTIQKESGAWCDTMDETAYIFDSAQILKGLIAARSIYPNRKEIDNAILRGCEWILSCMTEEGRLITPCQDAWADECTCSEVIHTYCLSPLVEAANLFKRKDFKEKAYRILDYYKKNYIEKISNFNLLSHFYAYVMEAMIDMGEIEIARMAMEKIAMIQKENGAVPAYCDVDYVCSTGLFQLALVWFRLGEIDCGNKAFDYACKLQNESGGWYGSYLSESNSKEINTYFPDSEISWAVKYFLDALYYKNFTQFEEQSVTFGDVIGSEDGRYKAVRRYVSLKKNAKILDIGCGKGRYLKNLVKEFPYNQYNAVDLSIKVMKFLDMPLIEKRQGTLTNIPYEDSTFDIVYTCEALEHAVDIESAVKEMARVTKNGGIIIVVDKNREKLGFFEIEEWEQWFDESELKEIMLRYCVKVDVDKKLNYDEQEANELFYCWAGRVKK